MNKFSLNNPQALKIINFHIMFLTSQKLCGLKQAPKSWYDRMRNCLIDHNFSRGKFNTTLFIKRTSSVNLIIQIYVDDIFFGSSNATLCKEFSEIKQSKFQMNMPG